MAELAEKIHAAMGSAQKELNSTRSLTEKFGSFKLDPINRKRARVPSIAVYSERKIPVDQEHIRKFFDLLADHLKGQGLELAEGEGKVVMTEDNEPTPPPQFDLEPENTAEELSKEHKFFTHHPFRWVWHVRLVD